MTEPKKPRGRPRKHPPGAKQMYWVVTPEEAKKITEFINKRRASPK